MSTAGLKRGDAGQAGLGGFGAGSVVQLDGGKRLRLDDRVDFWPATQAWQTTRDGPDGAAQGIGFTSLLAYLTRMRAAEGRAVEPLEATATNRQVLCNYCGRHADLHGGLAVYPDRKDLADRQFWVCWACDAWVGCKRGTDEPFGELADEELRAARIAAHKAFDPIWQNELMSRSAAYAWLAEELGVARTDCHIGLLSLQDSWRMRDLVWSRFGDIEPPTP
ncbi:MAG TPA: zinc-finger-containing protein [Roseateles sp.]|nr:zinc-finger-containing protein [Roseateles sp.]